MYNNNKKKNFGKKVTAEIALGGAALGTTAQISNTASAYKGEKYVKKASQTLADLIFGKDTESPNSTNKETFVEKINAHANRLWLGDKVQAKHTNEGIVIKDTRKKENSKLYIITDKKINVYLPGISISDKETERYRVNQWFNAKHSIYNFVSGNEYEYKCTEKSFEESGLKELLNNIGITNNLIVSKDQEARNKET